MSATAFPHCLSVRSITQQELISYSYRKQIRKGFRSTIAKVRYRNTYTCRTVKLKLILTLVLTLTDTGGAVLTLMLGYRSL